MAKYAYMGILCLLFLLFGIITDLQASTKSLYIVRHSTGVGEDNLYAFELNANELVFQEGVAVDRYGYGPIDLTIDNNSETLFMSHENSGGMITLLNTKTLDVLAELDLSGPSDFTGIVFDANRNLLYGTERNTNDLYVFHFSSSSLTLMPDPCNPIQLGGGISNACGVALDGDTLYVSNYHYDVGEYDPPQSSLVYKYDVSDNFTYLGTEDMDEGIVGIAQDSTNDLLYGGAYANPPGNYDYLVKEDIESNAVIKKDIDTNATALAVDPDTGLVYISSYRYDPCSFYYGSIEVYDTSDWISDANQTVTYEFIYNSTNDDDIIITSLAGLAIGGPYKPEIMSLTITPDPCTCIYPAGQGDPCHVEYTICYSGGGQGSQTNTWLTAHLPWEVYPTDPCDENYFWEDHVFMWSLGTVAEDANDCISFEVYVTDLAEPLGSFDIRVELESDTSYTTETITTNVCCWGGDIIYVNETADSLRLA